MNFNLTIVLTLYGRHECTARWLKFISQEYRGSQIIIADGNKSPFYVEKLIKKYPRLNIKHLWQKKDTGVSDFINKVRIALTNAENKYVIFADNDDLIIESVVLQNIQKMAERDLLVGVCESYRFSYYKNKLSLKILDQLPFTTTESKLKRLEKSITNFPSDYIYYAIFGK